MLYRNRKCLDSAKHRVDELQWSYTAAALMEGKVLLCLILSTLKVKDMFFHLTGPVPRGLVSISLAHRLKWLIMYRLHSSPVDFTIIIALYWGGLHPGPLGSSGLSLC